MDSMDGVYPAYEPPPLGVEGATEPLAEAAERRTDRGRLLSRVRQLEEALVEHAAHIDADFAARYEALSGQLLRLGEAKARDEQLDLADVEAALTELLTVFFEAMQQTRELLRTAGAYGRAMESVLDVTETEIDARVDAIVSAKLLILDAQLRARSGAVTPPLH